MQHVWVCLVALLGSCSCLEAAGGLHEVGRHLATKTRYAARLPIPGAPSIHSTSDPEGYNATALWLLSRHGSRWPTAQRMQQIASLAATFQDATNTADFPWMRNWTAPTAGLLPAAGELHSYGEDELWSLGVRLRDRFPHVLRSPYLPRRHPIVSTQVPRAAASAFAFAAGFFPHHHTTSSSSSSTDPRPDGAPLGPSAVGGSRPQPVAISMSPKDQDPLLRFYDVCPAYTQHQDAIRPWLVSWLVEQWAALAPSIAQRLGLTRTLAPCEVDALWTLCQYEAGLLGEARRACAVLGTREREVMEWLDDVGLLEAQGWGSDVNYRIAAPLLQDMRRTLQAAAGPSAPQSQGEDASSAAGSVGGVAGEGGGKPHARLLFAHCETLVPLATLLGLFEPELPRGQAGLSAGASGKEEAAVHQDARRLVESASSSTDIQAGPSNQRLGRSTKHHHALNEGVDACTSGVPPTHGVAPPEGWRPRTPLNDSRLFRGGRVSPFGANLAIVLYRRKAGDNTSRPLHLVRLLYNEQVLAIPGCTPSVAGPGSAHDCDLQEFLALTAAAAADSERFDTLCAPKPSAT